jgi:hypothetical protein
VLEAELDLIHSLIRGQPRTLEIESLGQSRSLQSTPVDELTFSRLRSSYSDHEGSVYVGFVPAPIRNVDWMLSATAWTVHASAIGIGPPHARNGTRTKDLGKRRSLDHGEDIPDWLAARRRRRSYLPCRSLISKIFTAMSTASIGVYSHSNNRPNLVHLFIAQGISADQSQPYNLSRLADWFIHHVHFI